MISNITNTFIKAKKAFETSKLTESKNLLNEVIKHDKDYFSAYLMLYEIYDKINSKKSNKYVLIGDMLELGSHSKKLHQSIAPIINQTKIDKVFVKGKMASIIFSSISESKKGRILLNKSQIIQLIRKDLNNNDYLMIKASLATGFNDIVKDLKGLH